MAYILLIHWILSLGAHQPDTHRQFEVFHNNQKVGVIYISRTVYDDTLNYQLYSDVTIEGIVKVRIEESISNVYVQGYLHSASHHRNIHNISDQYNQIWRDQHGYHSSTGKWKHSHDPIRNSVLQLYFEEPNQVPIVYSEQSQNLITLNKTGQQQYRVTQPNGNYADYLYTSTGLQTVHSVTQWGEVTFSLKQ